MVQVLLVQKLCQIISVYDILYKTPTGTKPLCIRFDKIDGFIISLDTKIKHLVLFHYGLMNKICDKIKYVSSKKVVLKIVLIIILERLKLIVIILYLLKNFDFS